MKLRMSWQMEMVNQGYCPNCGEWGGLCATCEVCHSCDTALTDQQGAVLEIGEQAAWEEEHAA